jgi:hypothetical protein
MTGKATATSPSVGRAVPATDPDEAVEVVVVADPMRELPHPLRTTATAAGTSQIRQRSPDRCRRKER